MINIWFAPVRLSPTPPAISDNNSICGRFFLLKTFTILAISLGVLPPVKDEKNIAEK